MVLESVVVDSDGERNTDFVSASISLANGLSTIVNLARNQVLLELKTSIITDSYVAC